MKIKSVVVGSLETNCYILEKDGEILIIDPGDEANKIIESIAGEVVGIIITHHHFDHVGALESIKNYYNAKVYDYSNLKEENNNFHKYLWYVIIFSIVGLLAEFIYGVVITKKGFILGPLAIIYGIVAGIDIAVLKKYKGHKVKLFILGAVLVTAIQYAISFLFEGILGATFWNYSEIKFNLNGRACVLTSILWGILTVIVIEFVQKWLDKILDKKPNKIIKIVDIIITIAISLEIILTFWGITVYKIRMKEEMEGKNYIINNTAIEIFQNKVFSNENIEKIFPNLKITIIQKGNE